MAKRSKTREPELIIEESVDEKTNIWTHTRKRGVLSKQIKMFYDPLTPNVVKNFGTRETIRQELEERQEEVRTSLEKKDIPSGRSSHFISVNGEPFRPTKDSETIESLLEGPPVEIVSWAHIAEKKTEVLTLDRARIDFLIYLECILNKFDDKDLLFINKFAEAYYMLTVQEKNINNLASEQLNDAERAKAAGKKSGESRRAMAEKNWRKPALKLAIELRKQNPGLSQSALASRIINDGKDAIPFLPTHKILENFIRENERSGPLSPRKKGT